MIKRGKFFSGYEDKYFLKNRKLKLEEYDDDGNIIDSREFDDDELAMFISIMGNELKAIKIARKKSLENFNDEDLKIIERFIVYSRYRQALLGKGRYINYIYEDDVELFKKLLEQPKEKLNYALDICMAGRSFFLTKIASEYGRRDLTFAEAIKFIDDREGIYYAVNNKGKRVYDFIDKPTLKQSQYQRKRNGNRTVFLNFSDWKEYIVDESELI